MLCSLHFEADERQNLETMFRAVMGAVSDAELPVRIQAAIALPEMVRYEEGVSPLFLFRS